MATFADVIRCFEKVVPGCLIKCWPDVHTRSYVIGVQSLETGLVTHFSITDEFIYTEKLDTVLHVVRERIIEAGYKVKELPMMENAFDHDEGRDYILEQLGYMGG